MDVQHREAALLTAFALAAMGVADLERVAISTGAPAMKADLGLTDVQMGLVFSAFTLVYALFEVPSGWLADRFGAPHAGAHRDLVVPDAAVRQPPELEDVTA